MGMFDRAYEKFVLQPLADKLKREAASAAETVFEKGARPAGAVLRDNFSYQNNSGAQRQKPGAGIDFKTLRRFAKQYDVARAAINRRKRQLNQLQWDIVSADPDVEINEVQAREIKKMFKAIGGYRVRFRTFIDKMVEDLLVLDAVAIYKRPTMGGSLYSLQVLDSSTIKLRVDETGGTPMPPEIAYRQFIRGTEVASFNADEMYYEMMNPSTDSPYGLSPLESMILTVSTALKSQVLNMTMLTEGNIPEGYMGVPDTWSPDKIKEFQELWDAALSGDAAATSKIKFGPEGAYERFVKPEDMRFKELQEWLMKTTCMMFEIQPQELGFTDTVNKATGEVQQDIGRSAGLIPLANFFEEIFTDVVQVDLGYPDMVFKYQGLEDVNEKEQAEVSAIRINSGYSTVDEERALHGKEPLGVDKPFTSVTPTFIDPESMQAKADAAKAITDAAGTATTPPAETNPPANTSKDETKKSATPEDKHINLVTELRAFRKFAVDRVNGRKPPRAFNSDVLPASALNELNTRLTKAKDADMVRDIFREYMQDYQIDFLANMAEVKKSLAKVL